MFYFQCWLAVVYKRACKFAVTDKKEPDRSSVHLTRLTVSQVEPNRAEHVAHLWQNMSGDLQCRVVVDMWHWRNVWS